MKLTKGQRAQLTFFLKRTANVRVAILFGSQARETAGPLSDVDIGLVLRPNISPARRATLMKTLFVDCARLLKTDHIDLIDLAQAPVLLRYRILMEGKLLFVKEKPLLDRFRFQTVQAYEDFRPHLDAQARIIRKKIASYVTT